MLRDDAAPDGVLVHRENGTVTYRRDDVPSNWGRWGAADQLGCLNLLTDDVVRRAATLVRLGKVYSLGMPLEAAGPQWPMRHKTWRVTTYRNDAERKGSADDVITMHSHSGTHIDALSHVWYDGKLYNGFDVGEHLSSAGATRNSIDRLPSIAGRAVLLDVAGHRGVDHLELGEAIGAAELDACAGATGVEIGAGDILLVRTGWLRVFATDRARFDRGEPGLDTSTLAWLRERDIVAVGSDNHGVEVMATIPPADIPFHRVAIRDLGMYLLENLRLDELAADGVRECFFVVAPLRLTSGVGSPINPLAIV